ncbi:hypothetical protein FMJ68_25860 [Klebsiella grimontii]|nr:hypothetical protein [Klebsiella grimontii]MBZ7378471.1 hypothetical protein [Klebsiella grimontii]
MLMTEPPWSYPVTCKPAGINIPQSRQGTMQAYWPCIPLCVFPGSSANHPVNRESHSPSVANTFLPSGSRFLIAFISVKLAPGYTDSCSLILPG